MKKLISLIVYILLSVNIVFAQLEIRSLEFDGLTRNYNVFLPQNYQPNMPVVITLHAATMTMERMMGYSRMNDIADTAGFIVVYPAGIVDRWNWSGDKSQGDDVGFISALIDSLETQYNIDMERIYLTGASSGGFMTHRLLGEIGHRFAAAASVAGAFFLDNWKPSQFSPILIIHGTGDATVQYGGGALYPPVEGTINSWLQNNNCSLPADTLLLPDIDTTDNCTIEKISWTNCSGNISIIHYKVIDGAHHWPGGNVNFMNNSSGLNLNNDINSGAEMWNFFKNYTNPLVNMAHTVSMEVNPLKKYFTQADTLTVNAHLTNPENHPVKVYAVITGDEKASQDSIELFDDGVHRDGEASDNFYSGSKLLSEISEDMYTVELYTKDLITSTTHFLLATKRFTTKGPIEFVGLEFTTNDTIPNPGDRIKFSLVLRNYSVTDTVFNVDIKLIINDPTIKNTTTGKPTFGDIPPGDSVISTSRDFALSFGDSSTVGLYEFGLEIKSNNELFWYDTFTIDVLTGLENESSILPKKFVLEQNYPNPFNPSTKIKYSIPSLQTGYIPHVQLLIYDILGREVTTLVNQKQKPGNYEITWNASAYPSGVYFYQLTAGEITETKKLILLE